MRDRRAVTSIPCLCHVLRDRAAKMSVARNRGHGVNSRARHVAHVRVVSVMLDTNVTYRDLREKLPSPLALLLLPCLLGRRDLSKLLPAGTQQRLFLHR